MQVCGPHAQWGQMLESGAKKGLLQGQAKRIDGSCSKNPKLPNGLGGEFL